MLPAFNEAGLLPTGDYELSLNALEASHLVRGSSGNDWDAAWRRVLVRNLRICAAVLWAAGVTEIFVNGSFVEDKPHPGDIDGYFECDFMDLATGALQRRLNAIDPNTVWTWDRSSRRPHGTSTKAQLPMWHAYRVELYPSFGNFSGIVDRHGNDMPFPAAFRQQLGTYAQKGIIKLLKDST